MSHDKPDLSGIPGDSGRPLLGHTLEILRDPWRFDHQQAERYGPVYKASFLGRSSVSLTTAELLGDALLDRQRNLSSAGGWSHTIGEVFKNGLMLRDFEDHKHHRKLMQFAFRGVARRGYHERLERDVAGQLAAWAGDAPFAFYPRLKRALLEQAGRVLLGVEEGAKIAELSGSFSALTRASVAVVRVPVPGSPWRRGMLGRRRLEAFFSAEIPKRRAGAGTDLFSVLCQAKDEEGVGLQDDEIVDHMIFLLFASHDTTATAITTLVDELSMAPQLQERAAEECERLAADSDGILSFDDLDKLEYIDRCMREALRLNPPVAYIARRTVSPCVIDGHELPGETPLILQVSTVQHDPELWPEPFRFDPDRFAPDQEEPKCKRPTHAWAAFGGGAHRCIGAELARQQIKVFMFHLLTRYRVERIATKATAWRRLPLPVPVDGLPVRLRPVG